MKSFGTALGQDQRTGKRAVAGNLPAPSGVQNVLETAQNAEMDVRNVFLPHVKVAAIGSGYSKGAGNSLACLRMSCRRHSVQRHWGGDRRRSSTKEPDCTAAGEAGIRKSCFRR